MRVLFDTSAFITAHTDPARLGHHLAILEDPDTVRLLSALVGWEISIKYRLGKLALPAPPEDWVVDMASAAAMTTLPVELTHALAIERLPDHHHDPFDRLLIATATVLGIPIITSDRVFGHYDIETLLF